jgi:hypothetical protein
MFLGIYTDKVIIFLCDFEEFLEIDSVGCTATDGQFLVLAKSDYLAKLVYLAKFKLLIVKN